MPILLLGKASMEDLNSRLETPLLIDRFRANIIFEGGAPYVEDNFADIRIGDASFYGAKPCIRCNLTTIDQQTGAVGKEPIKTMASYRRIDNNIYMGMNVLVKEGETIRVGDEVSVESFRPELFS